MFLNDIRFVNTARVIDIKAHVEEGGPLFNEVKRRIQTFILGW